MGHSGATLKDTDDICRSDLHPPKGARTGNVRERARCSGGNLIPLNYKTVSDEVLVELYQNKRDEVALSNIVRRYRDTVFGFAMKMIKNPSDAEDIVQEVSLTLVKKLHTFKGNSKFSTWLYKVTLNTCYMVLNKTKKTSEQEVHTNYLYDNAPLSSGNSGKWTENPSRINLYRESAKVIEGAVYELSDRNREIIRLKDMEGYSNVQVSKKMGISISAVKSRLLRSRIILRKKLGCYFRETA